MRRGKTTFGFRKILTTLLFLFVASGFFLVPGKVEAAPLTLTADFLDPTVLTDGGGGKWYLVANAPNLTMPYVFENEDKKRYVYIGQDWKIKRTYNSSSPSTKPVEDLSTLFEVPISLCTTPGTVALPIAPPDAVALACTATVEKKTLDTKSHVLSGNISPPAGMSIADIYKEVLIKVYLRQTGAPVNEKNLKDDGGDVHGEKGDFSFADKDSGGFFKGQAVNLTPKINHNFSLVATFEKDGKKYEAIKNFHADDMEKCDPFDCWKFKKNPNLNLAEVSDFTFKEISELEAVIPDDPLNKAIESVVTSLQGAVTFFAGWINDVLNSKDILKDGLYEGAWLVIRNLALTLMAIAIVIIAFANVLSIDIERWGVAKMIPKLVIAIILAYFSFFIAELFVDLAGALTNQLYYTMKAGVNAGGGNYAINVDAATDTGIIGGGMSLILVAIMLVIMVVVLLYLTIILIARIVAINILTVLAPMAFILGILPWTESLTKKWWSEFSKWVFMGPAVMFMLLVGNLIIDGLQGSGDQTFIVLVAAVAYFMAAQIPVQMGGSAMKAMSGYVKKAGSWAGRPVGKFARDKTGITGLGLQLKARSGRKDAQIAYKATKRDAMWSIGKDGKGSKWGRRVMGANESQAKAMRNALIGEEAKDMEEAGLAHQADALGEIMKDKSPKNAIKREAAAMLSAASGNVDTSMAIALGQKEGEKELEDAWKKSLEENGDTPETQALEESYRTLAKENKLKVAQELGELAKNNTGLFKSLGNDFTDLAIISGNTGLENMAKGKRKVMALSGVKGSLIESSQMRGDADSIIKNPGNVDEVMLKGTAGAQQELMDLHRRLNSGQIQYGTDDASLAQKAADAQLLQHINSSQYFSKINNAQSGGGAGGGGNRSGRRRGTNGRPSL